MQSHEPTIPAEGLVEGQWFRHEPVPGLSWTLLVVSIEPVGEKTSRLVRIITTDAVREVLDYPRDRVVRLVPSP